MIRFNRVCSIVASVLTAALFVACSEAIGPEDPQFARGRPEVEGGVFTRCTRQPYAKAGAWIGPSGGIIKAGRHVLYVPAGALAEAAWITMETPSGSLNRVVFGPDGLTFDPRYPAHLVMNYQNCDVSPDAGQVVALVNGSLNVLEVTASKDNQADRTVDAKLLHFSDYVLLSTYAVVY